MAKKLENSNIREITSAQHPLIKYLVRLRLNRDYREEHKSVLIEGLKLIKEVCPHLKTKLLIGYDKNSLPQEIKSEEIILVTESIMHKLSGVQHPEGFIAEVEMPPQGSLKNKKWILVLDQINDPGNLGTLLRTALALGWEGVFLLENCCDPYNDKALRAAKGATFRIPIRHGNWDALNELMKLNHLTPVVADLHGDSIDEIKIKEGIALILSNEARGLREETAKLCQKVTIPMPGNMESLNVAIAGAILMHTLRTK